MYRLDQSRNEHETGMVNAAGYVEEEMRLQTARERRDFGLGAGSGVKVPFLPL